MIAASGFERFALFGVGHGTSSDGLRGTFSGAGQPLDLSAIVVRPGGSRSNPATKHRKKTAPQRDGTQLETDTPAYAQFFTTFHFPDASSEQIRSYNELLRLATSPANA